MSRIFICIIPLLIFLYSCSVGVKGSFLTYLPIGTNSNQFAIYLPSENKIFSSFQDLMTADVDQSIKSFFDDNFFVPFYAIGKDVLVVNQLPKKLNILLSSGESSYLLYSVDYGEFGLVQDIVFNPDYSAMLLLLNSMSPQGDFVYSLGFFKKGSSKIDYVNYLFTNVIKLDTDEIGNFYVFEVIDNTLKVSIFTSAFLMMPSFSVDLGSVGLQKTNWVFSSVVVTKPFQIFIKLDSLENYSKSIFLSFDYNTKDIVKKYEAILPKENFVMLSYLKNGFILCASYKNNNPVAMFLNPYDLSFKISHEIYLDFQYPFYVRGFKVSKDGKLIVSFIDLPDNRILFYYWDLVSIK
ncbi:MAG: hypothetical protein ACK4F9_06405 [Brevinematia bacterium]